MFEINYLKKNAVITDDDFISCSMQEFQKIDFLKFYRFERVLTK